MTAFQLADVAEGVLAYRRADSAVTQPFGHPDPRPFAWVAFTDGRQVLAAERFCATREEAFAAGLDALRDHLLNTASREVRRLEQFDEGSAVKPGETDAEMRRRVSERMQGWFLDDLRDAVERKESAGPLLVPTAFRCWPGPSYTLRREIDQRPCTHCGRPAAACDAQITEGLTGCCDACDHTATWRVVDRETILQHPPPADGWSAPIGRRPPGEELHDEHPPEFHP